MGRGTQLPCPWCSKRSWKRRPGRSPGRGVETENSEGRRFPLTLAGSVGPFAGEQDFKGPPQDDDIEPERPVADVVFVEGDPLFEGQLGSPADLPEAGDPGFHSGDVV